MKGGVLEAKTLDELGGDATVRDAIFSFVQISDSHIGFHREPNPAVVASLQKAIGKINAQQRAPAFIIHTGDLTHLSASTPIVLFAHMPLWNLYPQWGWGTDDSAQALGYLKRFGSVTVLNGHIHQKVEGNVTFHTARRHHSTPAPRVLACASALRILLSALALAATATSCGNVPQGAVGVAQAATDFRLATGSVIAAGAMTSGTSEVRDMVAISNFAFQPATLTVAEGSKVVWINRDEEPHIVISTGARFPSSPALDTDDRYTAVLATPGSYGYFCSIHPHMVGTIIVK